MEQLDSASVFGSHEARNRMENDSMFMKTYFTPDGIGASWMNSGDEDFLTRKCPILPDQRQWDVKEWIG